MSYNAHASVLQRVAHQARERGQSEWAARCEEAATEIERLTHIPTQREPNPVAKRLRLGTQITMGDPIEDLIDPMLHEGADEIERLEEWQSRAIQVLPLIRRDQGTVLSEYVSMLLRGEIPPLPEIPRD